MVTPPWAGPERAVHWMARLHGNPPEKFPDACPSERADARGRQARRLAAAGHHRQGRVISGCRKTSTRPSAKACGVLESAAYL